MGGGECNTRRRVVAPMLLAVANDILPHAVHVVRSQGRMLSGGEWMVSSNLRRCDPWVVLNNGEYLGLSEKLGVLNLDLACWLVSQETLLPSFLLALPWDPFLLYPSQLQ